MQSSLQHRTGTLTIQATPGTTVHVEQLRHEFEFGTAISHRLFTPEGEHDPDTIQYHDTFTRYFNAAVHENALKWYHTERQSGQINYDDAERMVEYCRSRGIVIRGHCIFWEVEKYVQDWIKQLPDNELRAHIERRAKEVTIRFKGRITEYDLNNEMIHGSYYTNRLGQAIIDQMFAWAKEGDPDATLYVNDYSILQGAEFDRYVEHIQSLLNRGVPVGGIGCQGHFSGPIDWAKFEQRLDRLAKFNLPIKITEYDQENVTDEQRAADLRRLYKICFAHPAIKGIYMWGFWERAHWRPETALWKADWSPTPAAEAFQKLVCEEWWTRETGQTDNTGTFTTQAFYGTHRVTVDGQPHEVKLTKNVGTANLDAR